MVAAGIGALVAAEFSGVPGLAWAFLAVAMGSLFGMGWTLGRSRDGNQVADLLLRAAETNLDARLITDPEGGFLYTNPAFLRLFVMATSLDAIASLIVGERSADEFKRLRAAASAGVAAEAELPIRVAKNQIEWRKISLQPLPNLPGHALWRVEDITARREMDTVRHREEDTLADMLDRLPAGFFSADPDGRILYANETLADWLGISSEELRSRRRRFADFVIWSGQPRTFIGDDDTPDAVIGGEVTLRGKDGSSFRALLLQSERRDDDGGSLYTRSMILREPVWRSAEDDSGAGLVGRLHWLFDEAPVGIVLLDLHAGIVDCNRAFLRLLGRERDAILGRPLAELVRMEDRSDVAAQLSKVVMGTSRAAHLEVHMPTDGATDVVASLFASRMADETGEVSGLVLHFIDTTEQKNLEVQFTQAQKIQAVGQLAGGIAHDFNNLLTAMIGFCDLLLTRHGPEDPSFADIMQIKQNANRATNLVRQLLAFSRKQRLEPVDLDITSALSELSNLLRRLIGETIELEMDLVGDPGLVRVDPVQFDQVIVNLVVNARDAMPGGGTLAIHTGAMRLDKPVQRGHELMPSGEYVMIQVIDTGVGIPKESISQIFEPFFSTKEKGSGTGLGLSTVYGIVRQTDGFIFVDSAPGEGTTFTIYLPQVAPSAAAAADGEVAGDIDAPVAESDLTGGGTVLLVEDEDPVRMFGARALRSKGYRVLEASSGESALDVINGAEQHIDLIISDIVMPGMDGHTFVRLVRQEMPEVKVILVSGYAEDAVAEDFARDPTIHFLPKPFTLRELAGKAKEVMAE